MEDLRGKRVLVAGLGKSGMSATRLLLQNGALVVAIDTKPMSLLPREARDLENMGAIIKTGPHSLADFLSVDMIVISPGVDSHLSYLDMARERGIPVIGELELASSFIDEPIIGITGSNGKSTTTTLLSEILRHGGKSVFTGGNIGIPLSEYVIQGIKKDYVVIEVSSFQLETIETFSPFVSILLNITPDHMDRYRDFDEYKHIKYRIFNNQKDGGYAILNMDDPQCTDMGDIPSRDIIFFSRKRKIERGIYIEDNHIVSTLDGQSTNVCLIKDIKLQGVHNLENAMAAIAGAIITGCNISSIGETLKEFPGLEHRMEFVRELEGIQFINDSKGTNVGAVIKSLEGFNRPVILIGGGRDKNSDFSILRPIIKDKVKLLILLGEAKEKIRKAINGIVPVIMVNSMQEAVHEAYRHALPGEIVLLSPGCASFDMFANFEERGKVFKEIVWNLQEKR